MKKRITQAQIAEHAGVSQSTVSQILSGRHKTIILPETCERVMQVAAELGYQPPKPTTRRRAKTRTIAFLIPEDRSYDNLSVYIRRLYTGVLQQLDEYRYHLIQAILHDDETVADVVRQGLVDGVVMEDECDALQVRQTQAQVPVVLLNHHLDSVDVDSCMPDNSGGMWQAVEYLYALGHRRIALFGMYSHTPNEVERITGFQHSMEFFDLPVPADYLALGKLMPDTPPSTGEELAYDTLRRWFSGPNPPTALLTLCDTNASEVLRAARALGIQVPQHLSLIGFDNTAFCEHTEPRLTSIDQPMEEMGKAACRLLIDRINGADLPTFHLRLGVRLVHRESTAAPCAPEYLPQLTDGVLAATAS